MYEANKLATAKPGAKPGHSGYWKRSSKAYMQLGGWAAIHSTPQLSAYADSFYQPSMTTLVAALDALELQGPAGPATGSAVPSAAASSAAAAAAPTPLAAHLPGPSSSALTVPWVSYAAVRQQRERMDLQSVRRRAGGGFGDVYVMSLEDMSAGQGEVVVKLYRRVIEKSGDVAADRSALGNAIRWGLQCARPDVLPLRGLVRDVSGEAVGVIYEHFPSTLERWITAKDEKERPSKSLSQLCGVLRDAAVATEYLHSLGYIHRDIKPANILVTTEGRGVLGDPDLITARKQERGQAGTQGFRPPEGEGGVTGPDARHSYGFDVYSMGMVLYVLMVGKLPAEDANLRNGITMSMDARKRFWGTLDQAPTGAAACTDAMARLVQVCCTKSPGERLKNENASEKTVMARFVFELDNALAMLHK